MGRRADAPVEGMSTADWVASLLQRNDGDVIGVAELGEDLPVGVEAGDIEAGEVHDSGAIAIGGRGEATLAVASGSPTCKAMEVATLAVAGGGATCEMLEEAPRAVAGGRTTCKLVEGVARWRLEGHRAVRRAEKEKGVRPGGPLTKRDIASQAN